ncbi:TPM domain-containing protein [Cytophagaceae bacterium DM2B3-1]|uniref:TPM domain-containing protein n=1 Tax=Xanthocytophaga flava TaxID=3048013 RepID=A0ABT7CRH3_9BACT|nr:TPM domain-containing protein [Xanthocytophaga flavus]MDJ1496354.1 TPM domain-containing protein [Xanthocytophaga flavus]
MQTKRTFQKTLLLSTLTGVLWACGSSSDTSGLASDNEKKMVADIAGALQACSYDGAPLTLSPDNLNFGTNADAAAVVGEIMKFTGLPQNFEVMEADVPNAAAIIVMGKDNLPHRVIAYNKQFMNEVRTATQNSNWAPISVLAHEIGHHLCGHTIMPGGSQPPTELEADKFSGFVLYKMGAVLADAQKAINTLIPVEDGPTHPGRPKRLNAIEDGWKQACTQQSTDCSGLIAAMKVENSTATTTTGETNPELPTTSETSPDATLATTERADVLPQVSETAIPTKFDRFVIDELNLVSPAVKQSLSKRLFDYTKEKGLEVVFIIAKDLQGKSGDEYALAMLRQLRVGKLELGNGVCLVAAPQQKEVGVASMPGISEQLDETTVNTLKQTLQHYNEFADTYRRSNGKYDNSNFLEDAFNIVYSNTNYYNWDIRFQNIAAMEKVAQEELKTPIGERRDDPNYRSGYHKTMARIKGTLTSISGKKESKFDPVMIGMPQGTQVMEMKTDDGKVLLLYVPPHIQSLMTAKLIEGKKYSFVVRENSLMTLSFSLISYDLLN